MSLCLKVLEHKFQTLFTKIEAKYIANLLYNNTNEILQINIVDKQNCKDQNIYEFSIFNNNMEHDRLWPNLQQLLHEIICFLVGLSLYCCTNCCNRTSTAHKCCWISHVI